MKMPCRFIWEYTKNHANKHLLHTYTLTSYANSLYTNTHLNTTLTTQTHPPHIHVLTHHTDTPHIHTTDTHVPKTTETPTLIHDFTYTERDVHACTRAYMIERTDISSERCSKYGNFNHRYSLASSWSKQLHSQHSKLWILLPIPWCSLKTKTRAYSPNSFWQCPTIVFKLKRSQN